MILKKIAGLLFLIGASGQLFRLIVQVKGSTDFDAEFSQSMGGMAAMVLFFALGIWLIFQKKPKPDSDAS